MPPHDAEFENGILTVVIIQTKTTGVGKKVEKLKAWVSTEAWLAERYWLSIGWYLFSDMNWGMRDFWLPAASKDLEGFQDRPQEYSEAASSGRALLTEAKVIVYDYSESPPIATTLEKRENDGLKYPLLLKGMSGFWTLHGDRATLNSWASCLDYSMEARQMLGRWSPSGSDEYVRTARRIVLQTQKEISAKIREGCTPQELGEDELYEDMAKYMRSHGALPAHILLQRQQLEMAFTCIYGSMSDRKSVADLEDIADFDFGNDPELAEHGEPEQGALENGPPQLLDAPVLPGEDSDPEEVPQVAILDGTWVISQNLAGKSRTLHRVGAGTCWRIPGIHYKYFEVLGEDISEQPEVEIMKLFDQPCKDCFPKLKGSVGSSAALESSSSDDDSSAA